MKFIVTLAIIGSVLTGGVFAQINSADDKEFKSLAKYVASEIKEGGKIYKRSKNYASETTISKADFRGCQVEIEQRFSIYDDSSGIDSKVSGSEKAGEVTASRHFSKNTSSFNLKHLDASLFQIKPANEKGVVLLFLETKNEDREIETQSGKVPRFTFKKGFLIRDSASEKVFESLKALTKMCQAK